MLSYQHQRRMLLFLLLFSLLSAAAAAAAEISPAPPPSIHELLPKYGLPPGLLPDSVESFSVSSNGHFTVNLQSPCYIHFDYLVYYADTITGVIRYGSIDELKGIKARKFLVWFDVDAIKVDLPPSDFIYFGVGWITKKLRVDQFQTVRSCEGEDLSEGISEFLDPAREMAVLMTE